MVGRSARGLAELMRQVRDGGVAQSRPIYHHQSCASPICHNMYVICSLNPVGALGRSEVLAPPLPAIDRPVLSASLEEQRLVRGLGKEGTVRRPQIKGEWGTS